jgi:hypothetical protein
LTGRQRESEIIGIPGNGRKSEQIGPAAGG